MSVCHPHFCFLCVEGLLGLFRRYIYKFNQCISLVMSILSCCVVYLFQLYKIQFVINTESIYCRQQELVDRYVTSFSLMAMYLFPNDVLFSSHSDKTIIGLDYEKQEPSIHREHPCSPTDVRGGQCYSTFFFCVCSVFSVQCFMCL